MTANLDRPPPSAAARIALVAVLIAGVAFRAQRLFHAGYHGDEPFEIFARRAVLEHGWPLLPSGQAWPYGGILLWPGALFTWIGGMSVFWNRLPFFVMGTAAVWVTARVAGRRLGAWGGVAAAAVVALHPGHIEWSSSTKIYAAASLLTALAMGPWLAWVLDRDDSAAPRFALFASLLGLVHPATAFTVAAFGVAGLAFRGPRWAVTPRTMLAFGAPLACLALFAFVIAKLDPGMSGQLVGGASASPRPFVGQAKHVIQSFRSHGWGGAWQAVPFVLAAAGAAMAGVRLLRRREDVGAARTTLAAALAWTAGLVVMSLVAKFQGGAYLLPSLPLLAIAAAGGLVLVASVSRALAAALAVSGLAVHVVMTRPVWPEVFDPLEEVAAVYARLGREAKAGEVSFGGGPHPVLYTDGKLTNHVVYGGNLGASSFLKEGRPFDRFFAHPVLGTVEEIRPVFDAAPRCWYVVTDNDLTSGRVLPEVHHWLTGRMELVARAPGLSLYVTRTP